MWCGKVLAQMVENTLIVWEDLGSQVLSMPIMCYLIYY